MEKIYPSIEELSLIENALQCPEDDCTTSFKCKSNLNLHLAKHHGNKKCAQMLMRADTCKEFHCPLDTCIYHTNKSFKLMKYLKQHYIKVHSARSHKCVKCNLGFPSQSLKKLHEDFCGIYFQCIDCTAKYNCYDTLTTHARRKGHKIVPKMQYRALINGNINACSRIVCIVDAKPKLPLLLPKGFVSINAGLVEDAHKTRDRIKGVKRKHKHKNEMQTQTQQIKAIVSTAETQTEVMSMHTFSSSISSNNRTLKKSIKTQTTTVTSSSRACNTSFDINSFTGNVLEIERNSLGTQTLNSKTLAHSITRESTAIHNPSTTISTHVNQSIGTEDLLQSYINDISSTHFCNTNMETQTDWFTNLELLSSDIHSNTYTQTCDDILPPDLRFNNTHTQTVLNDILRSVGSQTNMRLNGGVFTNTETQTDLIFEELLQEINS